MEFGLFSNGERRNSVAADTYDQDIEEIVLADELGFRVAWASEHYPTPSPNGSRPDLLTVTDLMLCKAAARTKQIKLGPAIRGLAFHPPLQVAMEAAVCDHLMRGRYVFAFGSSGPDNDQLRQRGIVDEEDFGQRVHRIHEALDFVLKCWTGPTPFDFEGEYFRGKGIIALPKPFQKPHMPIAVASGRRTAGSLELAGRMGFTLLTSQYESPEAVKEVVERYVEAGRAAGRQASRRDVQSCRFVYVSKNDGQARDEIREGVNASIHFHKTRDHYRKLVRPGGTVEDIDFDYLADIGHFCVGGPDTVYERIKTFYDESGGFGLLMLLMGKDYTSAANIRRSMEMFAELVAPRLASLDPDTRQN